MTSLSANAKNDKNFVIRIPPLEFRELRYFGKIEEQKEEDVIHYIIEIVWNNISKVIPPGHLDVAFDTPQPVTEGEKNKDIIKVWETVESFYSGIECVFSSSDTYLERIYSELSTSETPFDSLIMRIPLSTLLACPSVYVRPALPLPAKTAMLKISHILTGKMCKAPSRYEMPTAAELRSFKLELCLPHLPNSTKQI
ncbi:unnamed protein product, partial [Iphiclides podalirius]